MDTFYAAGRDPVVAGAPASQLFRMTADADPGLLPRVVEVFAKRSLVPDALHAERLSGDRLSVDLHVPALPAAKARHVAACLRETVGVRTVFAPAEHEAG